MVVFHTYIIILHAFYWGFYNKIKIINLFFFFIIYMCIKYNYTIYFTLSIYQKFCQCIFGIPYLHLCRFFYTYIFLYLMMEKGFHFFMGKLYPHFYDSINYYTLLLYYHRGWNTF